MNYINNLTVQHLAPILNNISLTANELRTASKTFRQTLS